ncbi:hypothetical protein [uncultured Flavobacterium sp.]|uniref:hypothetical protein n=1 Tax=uncultured Flavobacterium sp. TaxID=165435 RepID=UPI0025987263|nr:hypothetical protein [uncultured Flavobacterium sp.]
MKKIVRILGITLSVVVLGISTVSCSKDDDNNNLPGTNTSTLSGSYKVSVAIVDTAVDTNNDGKSNQDLLIEGYNACGFDDEIEITDKTFSIIRKGVSCSADEKNEVYEYKYDDKTKNLDLYVNGKIVETLKGAYIENDNNVKKLFYDRYDEVLKQTIYFKLTKA